MQLAGLYTEYFKMILYNLSDNVIAIYIMLEIKAIQKTRMRNITA
jgi:hypothetical protein